MATRLQVGEVEYFVDTERIVNRFPESYFVGLFAENEGPNGYFIDRDGELFKYVLAYLRVGAAWKCPNNVDIFHKLIGEAIFYGLDKMRAIIVAQSNTFGIVGNLIGNWLLQITMINTFTEKRSQFSFSGFRSTEHRLILGGDIFLGDDLVSQNIGYLSSRGYYLTKVDKIEESGGKVMVIYTFMLKQDPV